MLTTPAVELILFCWCWLHMMQAAGAEVVLALTHMRAPNDLLLLQQVPEIDAVLGGHDHNYQARL